jgi:hypothetical protein
MHFNLSCQATEQLKLHSFSRLWTIENVTNNIRARRKIMLEPGLSSTSHVCQDRLPEVPSQKLINWSLGVVQELEIKMFPSKISRIECKEYNLVIVLQNILAIRSLLK